MFLMNKLMLSWIRRLRPQRAIPDPLGRSQEQQEKDLDEFCAKIRLGPRQTMEFRTFIYGDNIRTARGDNTRVLHFDGTGFEKCYFQEKDPRSLLDTFLPAFDVWTMTERRIVDEEGLHMLASWGLVTPKAMADLMAMESAQVYPGDEASVDTPPTIEEWQARLSKPVAAPDSAETAATVVEGPGPMDLDGESEPAVSTADTAVQNIAGEIDESSELRGSTSLQHVELQNSEALSSPSGGERPPATGVHSQQRVVPGPVRDRPGGLEHATREYWEGQISHALQALQAGEGPVRFFQQNLRTFIERKGMRIDLVNYVLTPLRKAKWVEGKTYSDLFVVLGNSIHRDGGLANDRISSALTFIFRRSPKGSCFTNQSKRGVQKGELGLVRVDGGVLREVGLNAEGAPHWCAPGVNQDQEAPTTPGWFVLLEALRM
jgi:hypothetical protein